MLSRETHYSYGIGRISDEFGSKIGTTGARFELAQRLLTTSAGPLCAVRELRQLSDQMRDNKCTDITTEWKTQAAKPIAGT